MNCWDCGTAIDAQDNYCRRCGAGQGRFLAWHLKPFWIAVLALFALGPLALPLVWRTPRWGRNAKIAAAALILVYTAWLVLTVRRMALDAQKMLDQQLMGGLGMDPKELEKLLRQAQP